VFVATGFFVAAGRPTAEERGRGTVSLVRDGQTKAAVIVAENPSRPVKLAVKELIHYVKKITGVELPVCCENSPMPAGEFPCRILVGESQQTRMLGLSNQSFSPQEYLIETRGHDLILIGRDAEEYGEVTYEKDGFWPEVWKKGGPYFIPLGSLYAVDTFLENVAGVRWYLPGEIGEVCPQSRSLVARNIYLRTRPWTRYRFSSRLSYREPFKFYGYQQPDVLVRVSQREMALWFLRMKMGGGVFACNHSFSRYFERFGKTHPEWWKQGRPTTEYPHPDYANPDLIQQATEDALTYFSTGQAPPGAVASGDYFAVMPNDGRRGLIWSEAGEKLRDNDPERQAGFSCGWASDFVFSLVNQVAARVREKFPEKWITCAAYGPYFMPPRRLNRLEPNVAIQQCGFLTQSFEEKEWRFQTENLKQWSRLTRELYVWEYYLIQAQSGFKAFPVVYPHHIARTMRFLKEIGVKGMFFEASAAPYRDTGYTDATLANPGEDLLNHYVTCKFLVDDTLDIEKLLEEHYHLFYGPASQPMKEFFRLIESRWSAPEVVNSGLSGQRKYWEKMCTGQVLKRLKEYLSLAKEKARNEPYRTRVSLMEQAIYRRLENNFMEHQFQLSARPRLSCPRVEDVSSLNEASWTRIPRQKLSYTCSGTAVTTASNFQLVTDGRKLCFRISCQEPLMEKMFFSVRKKDEVFLKEDDTVAIAVDPGRTRNRYFLLTVNSAGSFSDTFVEGNKTDFSWQSNAVIRVVREKQGWTVIGEMPLSVFGPTGENIMEVWGLNVFRHRPERLGREEEISCWVPTFGEINRPDEFGVLTFNSEKPEEPVIHYNFENDFVSSGKVQDVSGHDCQALCQVFKEGENWDGRNVAEGINGRGLLLRGESAKQYLTVKFSPDVSLVRDDFTIAFWVKLTASGGVLAGSTTSAPFWLLNLAGEEQGAYPIFMFNSGSGNKTVAFHAREAGKLNDGRWHHLVLVIDRGRMVRIYVDGKLAGIQNIAGHRGSLKNVLTIGGPYWYPNGVVDEFSVFRGSHGQAFVDLLYSGYRRSE